MNLHEKYFDNVGHFSLDRRMENLPTSETLISSLQRQLGLTNNSSEADVWSKTDLYKLVFDTNRNDIIAKLFQEELSSPISKKVVTDKQSSRSILVHREYVKPVVPQVAGYIHSARSGSGSPWNPGRWLLEELTFGFDSEEEYLLFALKLADGFNVLDKDKHELALYLRNSSRPYKIEINQKLIKECWLSNKKRNQFGWRVSKLHQNYIQLIDFVLDVKNEYSRYRWFLFLDSVLRLFSTISSVWRFKQPSHFIDCIERGKSHLDIGANYNIIKYGDTRLNVVKKGLQEYIIKYLQIFHICDVLGINAKDKKTDELFIHLSRNITPDILRDTEVRALETIRGSKSEFDLKSSTLKNSKEFLEYVGVQKQDYSFKTVDYTYHYEKQGRDYKFAFGDALLLILVKYVGGIKSSDFTSVDFVESLAGLGIKIDYSEFSLGSLGKALQRLGLVEELSDSDSGMIFRAV